MNRLFYIPRESALKELAAKYPFETGKERKIREKAEFRKRMEEWNRLMEQGVKNNLILTVIACRGLLVKNAVPSFTVSLCGEKYKTKAVKSNSPTYSYDASFTFSLHGVDDSQELECVCFNHSKMSGPEFLGELFIPISRVREYASMPIAMWLPLRTQTSTRGEIALRFIVEKTGSVSDGHVQKEGVEVEDENATEQNSDQDVIVVEKKDKKNVRKSKGRKSEKMEKDKVEKSEKSTEKEKVDKSPTSRRKYE